MTEQQTFAAAIAVVLTMATIGSAFAPATQFGIFGATVSKAAVVWSLATATACWLVWGQRYRPDV